MASTEDRARRNEVRLPRTGGGAQITGGGAPGATPSIPAPAAPQNLRLIEPRLIFSAVTAKAGVTAVWQAPAGIAPDEYLVQYATDAAFTAAGARTAGRGQLSLGLDDLPVDTDVYVRVAGKANKVLGDWSATAMIHTPVDNTPPDPVTDLDAAFAADGTLEVRATPPASANYKHMQVRVLNPAGTVEWELDTWAAGVWRWPPARNKQRTAGVWARSVLVEVRAVSWGGVASTAVTDTATMPVPATPTGLTSTWQSDDGTAAADVTISWATVAGMRYLLVVDTGITEREVVGGAYPYSFAQNAQDHGGAADKTLSVSLVAMDGLEQRSTAATLTATNAAPPAAAITTYAGYNSTISLALTESTAKDWKHFEIEVSKDSVVQAGSGFVTRSLLLIHEPTTGAGSYTYRARQVDLFGQAGSWSAATAAVALNPLTIATLREDAVYTDSAANNPATLKAVLADDIL